MTPNYSDIAQSIRDQDLPAYQRARYSMINDGDIVPFTDEDFTETNFSLFNAGFFAFNNCTLNGAKGLSGSPIYMNSCKVQSLDLREFTGTLYAKDCDLSGLVYSVDTFGISDSSSPSIFENCIFDHNTIADLTKRGAQFISFATLPDHHIAHYAAIFQQDSQLYSPETPS